MNLELSSLDAEQLAQLIADIDAEFARRAGGSLELVSSDGTRLRPTPSTGAVLCVDWCTDPGESETWYPSLGAAQAALELLARQQGRVVSQGRDHLDLTAPGCHSSAAWVREIG